MSYLSKTLIKLAKEHSEKELSGIEEAIDNAERNNDPLVGCILDFEAVNGDRFLKALAEEFNLPWWDKPYITVPKELQDKIPTRLALSHHLVPVQMNEEGLWLLTYNPFNLLVRQQVAQAIPHKIFYILSTRRQILHALRQGYGIGADTFEEIIAGRAGDEVYDSLKEEISRLDDEEDSEASVVKFVNNIIRDAIYERATDIHFEPMDNELRIRIRIDGVLNNVPVPPQIKLLQDSVISRLKIMSKLDIAERRLPQDGRINLEVEAQRIDVRVATIPSVTGESVSLRLLGQEKFNLKRLGLEEDNEEKILKLLSLPNGIILITGPTGSGKSTTLYTMLSYLNDSKRRIVTIEDPVENKIPGIVQIAVKDDINLTFARGLRSILRGDPDIVMVGEMRDQVTVETAIRAALTGHLVLSTLHTNDAISGVTRLIDMGIEPFLLSTSVRAFIAQRLVRILCNECKVPAKYPTKFLKEHGFDPKLKNALMQPKGCESCRNTGYQGRTALMEICLVTEAFQEMVAQNQPEHELRKQADKDGMSSLRIAGWEKAIQGITSLEEVLRVTFEEKEGV